MENTFVTIRKPRTSMSSTDILNTTLYEETLDNSPNLETSRGSLPNIIPDQSEIETLKEQMAKLYQELASAHQEVSITMSENFNLKKIIEKMQKTITLYKKIGISDNFIQNAKSPALQRIRNTAFNESQKRLTYEAENTTETSTQTEDIKANDGQSFEKHTKTFINSSNNITLDDTISESEKSTKENVATNEAEKSCRREKVKRKRNNRNKAKTIDKTEKKDQDNMNQVKYYMNDKETDKNTNKLGTEEENKSKTKKSPQKSRLNQNNVDKNSKTRVIIVADQQGRGLQQSLQVLLGPKFSVFCFWKSGAKLCDVLGSCNKELTSLSENDYVVILGGLNDVNPCEVKTSIISWLNFVTSANVLICEIPHNKTLNEKMLNYEVSQVCQKFKNCSFVDMNYSSLIPNRKNFITNLCRYVLREILKIQNKANYCKYLQKTIEKSTQTESIICKDFSTQTDFHSVTETVSSSPIENNSINITQNENVVTDGLFRV